MCQSSLTQLMQYARRSCCAVFFGMFTLAACAAEEPLLDAARDDAQAPEGVGSAAREPDRLYETPDDFFCIGSACEPGTAMDLEFNPARAGELWVVFRQTYDGAPCEGPGGDNSGCDAMRSKVVVLRDATSAAPEVEVAEDGNSWHFMRLVTALAFAEDDAFATVGEARTGNYTDDIPDYMGPTLWSSDPQIFAQDFELNGSHLDMLHATPFGMGIAHQREHVFWAFNGQSGAIDRYDFKASHEPGGEDHSDGTLARYVTGELARLEGVPSHMAFLDDSRTLLIADAGNGRVVALDTESGTSGGRIAVADDQIADPIRVDGADLSEIVPPGTLKAPSGLDAVGDGFVVCDAATGLIHHFNLQGELLESLDTGYPDSALGGIDVGPDNQLYVAFRRPGAVLRYAWPPHD
jgi:hypothetical protein